jgi:Ala-tRNA(Pro) deacylase
MTWIKTLFAQVSILEAGTFDVEPRRWRAMPAHLLKSFLETNGVRFSVIPHARAYTAHEIAHEAHVSGDDLAKTVIVRLNGELAMAVLRASDRLDLDLMAQAAGGSKVELASEEEFKSHFPDCEIGAMPPFGNLYYMAVYVDEALAADPAIAFNAGSHTELIHINYADFERLVAPRVVRLCRRHTA